MYCYQCEQTAKGEGCTKIGVCGKQPDVAELQDLLVHLLKGISQVALKGNEVGVADREEHLFICQALFSTLTNVDFDADRFVDLINRAVRIRDDLKKRVEEFGGESDYPPGPAYLVPAQSKEEMVKQGENYGPEAEQNIDPDIHSLREIIVYGIKGIAAYADHAAILGYTDDNIYEFIHEGLAATLDEDLGVDDLVDMVLRCGETNLRTMELLDQANTETYGHPEPTEVPLGAKKGKAILVSGHDLRDLDLILKQSEGKGIQVYTHGEMLPCHGYPELKKYPHFYGHYGSAWQNQHKEFPEFPGPIVMTTNCLQNPKDSYKDRIFTTGLVGWPDVKHIGSDKDFTPVIDKALEMEGYPEDIDRGTVMAGFGRNAVLGVADKVIQGVENKDIRHFFLVAGCDGAKPGRNYYTEFVEKVPEDCIVLTLACGKFRFFDKNLGTIGGIPRLLDVGQCNDAYSAIRIASALADAFECEVNDLPLSLVLSWYEQKAVAILLTLLYLGIQDIRLGPSLPAFMSENVLNLLVEKFNIKPISTPEEDLKAILGQKAA
ncbi:MAG: hydroxylamine reductase [Desulfurivibrionaceae bacterium]